MKIDPVIARKIMSAIYSSKQQAEYISTIRIDRVSTEVIHGHIQIIQNLGYIKYSPGSEGAWSLTAKGQRFASNTAHDLVWSKTMTRLKPIYPDVSLETVEDVAKAVARDIAGVQGTKKK